MSLAASSEPWLPFWTPSVLYKNDRLDQMIVKDVSDLFLDTMIMEKFTLFQKKDV